MCHLLKVVKVQTLPDNPDESIISNNEKGNEEC